MSRLAFHHIAWAKAVPSRHRLNLADSAIATPDLAALGLPHQTRYSNDYGRLLPALETAIAARLGAPGGRVVIAAGASEANACVYAGLLSAGDQVLVETPGYEPLRALATLFGFELQCFTRDRDRGFAGFAEAVERAITPRTRMVVVTNLHNPSSAALDGADVEQLERLADRHDLWIHCDETYLDAGRFALGTLASRGPRWVTTSSLTKAYGLGALRIGWIAGSETARETCFSAQHGLSSDPALPSVALALDLVPHLDRLRLRTHEILATNHARWNAFVERASRDGFDGGAPPLGTTTWCRFSQEGEGDAFSRFAGERFDIAITPGRFFGDSRGVRVALGSNPEHFAAALEQLERAVDAFALRSADQAAGVST